MGVELGGHLNVTFQIFMILDNACTLSECGAMKLVSTNFVGHAFLTFKYKLNKVKKAVSLWSREAFGDIFKQLIIRVELVKIMEALFKDDPSLKIE